MATKAAEKPTLAKQFVETILAEKPRREKSAADRVLYTIRLEQTHVDTLKDLATIAGVTHAELTRRAIYDFIAKEKAKTTAPAKKAPAKKAVAK